MNTARQAWLADHPYLAAMARFEAVVLEAAGRVETPPLEPPCWGAWLDGCRDGVPLLRCEAAGVRVVPAASYVLGHVAERAADVGAPGDLGEALSAIRDEQRRTPEARARAILWTLAGAPADAAPPHRGMVRFLSWAALRHVLAPVVQDPCARAGQDAWGRGGCPTCGALPALGHLHTGEGERRRELVCVCCRTRWRWERIGCPFCSAAADRLRILEVEGEERLRLDLCDGCKGYLKTYVGCGEEDLFLEDWPTLHLDVLARSRGFLRLGASLYELSEPERRIPA